MVRSGEVEGRARGALDLAVPVKLGPVVDGDRFEQVSVRSNQLNDPAVCRDGRAGAKLSDQDTPGDALDKADHAVTIGRADDRVHLPMPDLLPQFDRGRPLGDVTLAGQPSALVPSAMTLSPVPRLSKQSEQLSSTLLVATNEAVNRFVADLELPLASEPAT